MFYGLEKPKHDTGQLVTHTRAPVSQIGLRVNADSHGANHLLKIK